MKKHTCRFCGFETVLATMFFANGVYDYACPECGMDTDNYSELVTVSDAGIDTSDVFIQWTSNGDIDCIA